MIKAGTLTELDYLDQYYADLENADDEAVQPVDGSPATPDSTSSPSTSSLSTSSTQADTAEADLLDRISDLEKLITEDLARKPKFQKPQRQEAWQQEIDALWHKLEQLDTP